MSFYPKHFNPERAGDFELRQWDCEAYLNFVQSLGDISDLRHKKALQSAEAAHLEAIDGYPHDPGCPVESPV